MNNIITFLLLLVIFLAFIEALLLMYKLLILNKKEEDSDDIGVISARINENEKKKVENFGRFHGVIRRESLYDFLGFDAIEDGMIVRKGRKEYVMVLQCSGVNFDLRSENEKLAIEEGFLQFLNTLKYPVQLYVQTRRIDFTDVLDQYHSRIADFKANVDKVNEDLERAKRIGDSEAYRLLEFEKRRSENLYEYALDSIQYTESLNNNRDVLQQKTYVVVSYHVDEIGPKIQDYGREEIEDLVFRELYNRCNNLSNALRASSVQSRILNSQELVELLFNAFNRDELENINLRNFFNSDYENMLYTKTEDYIEKKKKLIQREISKEAVELATSSIVRADKKRKMEVLNLKLKKASKIKEKANKLIDDKKDVLVKETYNEAKKLVDEAEIETDEENIKKWTEDEEIEMQKFKEREFKEEIDRHNS